MTGRAKSVIGGLGLFLALVGFVNTIIAPAAAELWGSIMAFGLVGLLWSTLGSNN